MTKNKMSLVSVRFNGINLLLVLGLIAALSDRLVCQQELSKSDAQKIEQELLAASPLKRASQPSWKQCNRESEHARHLAAIDSPASLVFRY